MWNFGAQPSAHHRRMGLASLRCGLASDQPSHISLSVNKPQGYADILPTRNDILPAAGKRGCCGRVVAAQSWNSQLFSRLNSTLLSNLSSNLPHSLLSLQFQSRIAVVNRNGTLRYSATAEEEDVRQSMSTRNDSTAPATATVSATLGDLESEVQALLDNMNVGASDVRYEPEVAESADNDIHNHNDVAEDEFDGANDSGTEAEALLEEALSLLTARPQETSATAHRPSSTAIVVHEAAANLLRAESDFFNAIPASNGAGDTEPTPKMTTASAGKLTKPSKTVPAAPNPETYLKQVSKGSYAQRPQPVATAAATAQSPLKPRRRPHPPTVERSASTRSARLASRMGSASVSSRASGALQGAQQYAVLPPIPLPQVQHYEAHQPSFDMTYQLVNNDPRHIGNAPHAITQWMEAPIVVPQTFLAPQQQWTEPSPLPLHWRQTPHAPASASTIPSSSMQRRPSLTLPAPRASGGLGPETGGIDYVQRMQKLMKQREYAAKVRQENLEREMMRRVLSGSHSSTFAPAREPAVSAPRIVTQFDASREEARRRREKMKEYASGIPRPVLPAVASTAVKEEQDVHAVQTSSSLLRQLESRYKEKSEQVAQIRRDLGLAG